MSVLLLTVFLSLLLVSLFVALFLAERRRSKFGSFEQDALIPFSDEDQPKEPPPKTSRQHH